MTKIFQKWKLKQKEEAVYVSTSRNAVNGDRSEVNVDGKSCDEENLEEINGELLDQDIAEVKLERGRLPKEQRGCGCGIG